MVFSFRKRQQGASRFPDFQQGGGAGAGFPVQREGSGGEQLHGFCRNVLLRDGFVNFGDVMAGGGHAVDEFSVVREEKQAGSFFVQPSYRRNRRVPVPPLEGQQVVNQIPLPVVMAAGVPFRFVKGGVQTAVRQLEGVYTQSETYKATVIYSASEDGNISRKIINNTISVNVRRKWFAGVCNSIPASSAEVRALSGSGLYKGAGAYKFTINNYKTFVICIPNGTIKDVSLERYQYNFMDLDSAASPRKINVEGINGSAPLEYTMYVFSTATTSTETDNFTFKTN